MDTNIINWIHANLHGANFVNQLVKWITYLGDKGIIWLTLAFILLLFKKTRRAGVMLVIGVGATLIFNSLIFTL